MNIGKYIDDAAFAQREAFVPWHGDRANAVFERAVSVHATRRARKHWLRAGASTLAGVAVFVLMAHGFGRSAQSPMPEQNDSLRAARLAFADGSRLDGGYEAAATR